MRKVQRKPCYMVKNSKTKRVYSRCSTKDNAKKQLRLLRAIQYNRLFVPNSNRRKTKKVYKRSNT